MKHWVFEFDQKNDLFWYFKPSAHNLINWKLSQFFRISWNDGCQNYSQNLLTKILINKTYSNILHYHVCFFYRESELAIENIRDHCMLIYILFVFDHKLYIHMNSMQINKIVSFKWSLKKLHYMEKRLDVLLFLPLTSNQ